MSRCVTSVLVILMWGWLDLVLRFRAHCRSFGSSLDLDTDTGVYNELALASHNGNWKGEPFFKKTSFLDLATVLFFRQFSYCLVQSWPTGSG